MFYLFHNFIVVNSYLQFVLHFKFSLYKMSNCWFHIIYLRFSMVFIFFSICKSDYRFHIGKLSSNFTYIFNFSDSVIYITHLCELAQINGLHFVFYNYISNSG